MKINLNSKRTIRKMYKELDQQLGDIKNMSNNQKKRKAAEEHNANRVDMVCPDYKGELPPNSNIVKHEDMLEFTQFDTEAMTFTKRFDSFLNHRQHSTLKYPPISMEKYGEMTEEMMRLEARAKFVEQCRVMIIH